MQRMTTDTPQTNIETLLNFAYGKDKEVHLTYGDGMEDVTLADYIVDHAKSDFECAVNREDVINGDSCWECDCPLAVLNAVATQAAELRSKLKKYEDAEESGLLLRLPCKVGDTVWTNLAWNGWYLRESKMPYAANVVFIGLNDSEKMGGGIINVSDKKGHMMQFTFADIGKTVFLTCEEAKMASKWAKADGT